jgi:hypothetical protein
VCMWAFTLLFLAMISHEWPVFARLRHAWLCKPAPHTYAVLVRAQPASTSAAHLQSRLAALFPGEVEAVLPLRRPRRGVREYELTGMWLPQPPPPTPTSPRQSSPARFRWRRERARSRGGSLGSMLALRAHTGAPFTAISGSSTPTISEAETGRTIFEADANFGGTISGASTPTMSGTDAAGAVWDGGRTVSGTGSGRYISNADGKRPILGSAVGSSISGANGGRSILGACGWSVRAGAAPCDPHYLALVEHGGVALLQPRPRTEGGARALPGLRARGGEGKGLLQRAYAALGMQRQRGGLRLWVALPPLPPPAYWPGQEGVRWPLGSDALPSSPLPEQH